MTNPAFQEPTDSDAAEATASDSQAAVSTEPKPDPEKIPTAEEWARTLAALKKSNKDAEAHRRRLSGYEKADADKAEADKTEAEKRAAAEQRATDAELRATRLEVAHEKGLTPAQAKRLVGTTREELEADADEVLRDFPTTPAKSAGPKPDPSQGARGETKTRPTSLGAAVASHYVAK